jgi:hypothetical protein
MAANRDFHTATLLGNGRVLITGGVSQQGKSQSTAELYDPASGNFSATGAMIAARDSHFAIALTNGNVLIGGGNGGNVVGTFNFTAEIYDPSTGLFTQTGSMEAGRALPAAVLLADGRVLVTGGSDLLSAELYK